jgi:hypothetical protein
LRAGTNIQHILENSAIQPLKCAVTRLTMTNPPTSILNGWRTLPDELKLIILGYTIPCGVSLNRANFSKTTLQGHISHN